MTNKEKFEEIFNLKIDKYADDPCDIIVSRICKGKECKKNKCPLYKFWEKEYNPNIKEE